MQFTNERGKKAYKKKNIYIKMEVAKENYRNVFIPNDYYFLVVSRGSYKHCTIHTDLHCVDMIYSHA